MFDWLEWFTKMENTKPFVLVLFFVCFCLIILYLLTGKKRSERLESYKNIPFLDDDDEPGASRTEHTVKKDEH